MLSVSFTGSAGAQRKIRFLHRIDVEENATVPGQQATGTGDTTSGSTSVANATSALVAGQQLIGPGIPAGTVVTGKSGTTLTLSQPATVTATGVALIGVGPARLLLRDTDQNGSIVAPVRVPAGESRHVHFEPPLRFPNGCYLQVAAGTVRGTLVGE